ncbi:MAG: STAS domain-containing protein [Deltaproteobacteria bacterium]|nr:STAS domain-containing protein [Deltaproteobacteria bacterium]
MTKIKRNDTMTFEVKKNNKGCKLKIKGEMNIFNAVEIKNSLVDNLLDSPKIEIDLSGVSEMDTAGFQLLVMLKQEADCLNKGFKIVSCSPSVQAVLELYRMKDYIIKQ